MKKSECEFCGDTFWMKSYNHKYCCDECKRKAQYQRAKKRLRG